MKYSDYNQLRGSSGLDPEKVRVALGVDRETAARWHDEVLRDLEFSEEQAKAILSFFLTDRIENCCDRAFEAIPSEAVAIWLVVERPDTELRQARQRDCILLPNASRIHDLDQGRRRSQTNPRFETPLVNEPLVNLSLTTYPFTSGKLLNLGGDAITEHEAKKHKQNRANFIFKGGICESILHVPAFVESGDDRYPVLLLSLENKLDSQRRVIIRAPGDRTTAYTGNDEREAVRLAEEFKEQLLPLMKDLGMVKLPDQS